jgi:hypothetical protein
MADEHCFLHEMNAQLRVDIATLKAEIKASDKALILARRELLWAIGMAVVVGIAAVQFFRP